MAACTNQKNNYREYKPYIYTGEHQAPKEYRSLVYKELENSALREHREQFESVQRIQGTNRELGTQRTAEHRALIWKAKSPQIARALENWGTQSTRELENTEH